MRVLECGATVAEPGDTPGGLINSPRQIEYGGLLLGSGTPYRWKALNGWDSMPGLDLADSPRPTDHGDYPGIGLLQARLPSVTLQVLADTPAHMEQLLQLAARAWAYTDNERPFIVADTSRTLVADVRTIAFDIPHTPTRSVGVLEVGLQTKATRPWRRATTPRTVTVGPVVTNGGLVFPVVFPASYGTVTGAGYAVAINDGDTTAPTRVTFTGPCTAPGVVIGGQILRFNTTLTSGDTLSVDTQAGTVTLNGSADRAGDLAGDSVPPDLFGMTAGQSPVSFLAASSGPGAGATLNWYDTYN